MYYLYNDHLLAITHVAPLYPKQTWDPIRFSDFCRDTCYSTFQFRNLVLIVAETSLFASWGFFEKNNVLLPIQIIFMLQSMKLYS